MERIAAVAGSCGRLGSHSSWETERARGEGEHWTGMHQCPKGQMWTLWETKPDQGCRKEGQQGHLEGPRDPCSNASKIRLHSSRCRRYLQWLLRIKKPRSG
jgi:hypothetical protein